MNKGERLMNPNGSDNRVPHPTQVSNWRKREVNQGILPEVTPSPIDPYPSMREWGISMVNGRLETTDDLADLEEMNLSPAELLEQLHFEQEKEDEKQQKESGLIGFSLRTDLTLFASRALHTAAITASLRTPESFEQFEKLVAGAVFAASAEDFVKTKLLQSGQALLSGAKAHRLYKSFYPHATEIKQPFELSSLKGISEADAFITERDEEGTVKIANILEYKAGIANSNLQNPYDRISRYNYDHPELFRRDPEFTFLVPDSTKLPPLNEYVGLKLRIQRIPFNRFDLARFIDYFINTYRESDVDINKRSGNIRAEGSATIAEAYNWGRVKVEEGSAQVVPTHKVSVDEWLASRGHK